MTTQKEFIQRRQQEALIERLERRVGVSAPAPRPLRPASASVAGGSTPGASEGRTAFGAVALAAAGGMKIKKLVEGLVGSARPTPPASAPPKATSSVAGAAAAPTGPHADEPATKPRPVSALTGVKFAARGLQVGHQQTSCSRLNVAAVTA
jgi:hypothetical protein